MFPTYKWLLGPYGRAFLYVAKRHQAGIPLEQTSHGRRAVRADQDIYFKDVDYLGDARRFDMGERDHFISMEMASMGMEMVAEWGTAAMSARLAMLTARLADGLAAAGVVSPRRACAPRISWAWASRRACPTGSSSDWPREHIFVARRIGRLRISPHVYNDEADVDRFIEAFRRLLA